MMYLRKEGIRLHNVNMKWVHPSTAILLEFFSFSPSLSYLAPCALLKCDFYAECKAQLDGSLECVCPRQCPLSFDPVCGSDGQTYLNTCTLQVESCRTQTRIIVARRGQCGAYSSTSGNFVCPSGNLLLPSGNKQAPVHPGTSFYPETSRVSYSVMSSCPFPEQALRHSWKSSCPIHGLLDYPFLLVLLDNYDRCSNGLCPSKFQRTAWIVADFERNLFYSFLFS